MTRRTIIEDVEAAQDREGDLKLPISMDGRQWYVGASAGNVFRDDEDFDGIALTIEIKDAAEARAVLAALMGDA